MFDALTTGISKTPSAQVIEKADATLFLEIHVDETASVLERRIWFFTRHGDFYAKGMETHRQFLFDPATLGDLLLRAGFHAAPIHQYARLPFRPSHMGFVCPK